MSPKWEKVCNHLMSIVKKTLIKGWPEFLSTQRRCVSASLHSSMLPGAALCWLPIQMHGITLLQGSMPASPFCWLFSYPVSWPSVANGARLPSVRPSQPHSTTLLPKYMNYVATVDCNSLASSSLFYFFIFIIIISVCQSPFLCL